MRIIKVMMEVDVAAPSFYSDDDVLNDLLNSAIATNHNFVIEKGKLRIMPTSESPKPKFGIYRERG